MLLVGNRTSEAIFIVKIRKEVLDITLFSAFSGPRVRNFVLDFGSFVHCRYKLEMGLTQIAADLRNVQIFKFPVDGLKIIVNGN